MDGGRSRQAPTTPHSTFNNQRTQEGLIPVVGISLRKQASLVHVATTAAINDKCKVPTFFHQARKIEAVKEGLKRGEGREEGWKGREGGEKEMRCQSCSPSTNDGVVLQSWRRLAVLLRAGSQKFYNCRAVFAASGRREAGWDGAPFIGQRRREREQEGTDFKE